MFGFMWLFDSWSFTDCLLFGAIISATDPGKVGQLPSHSVDNRLRHLSRWRRVVHAGRGKFLALDRV